MANLNAHEHLACQSYLSIPNNTQLKGHQPQFSTAGFFHTKSSPRTLFNFSTGWRFQRGKQPQGHNESIDDSEWEIINAPHSVEILPEDASGSINYQGEVWYRKHFDLSAEFANKRIFLNFEAIQGKSKVWINGQLIRENFEGFLGMVLDITDFVKIGTTNVICVLADNSDDPNFPAGKNQSELDFTYVGGMYRNVWLYTTANTYITHANQVNEVSGGGVFVHFENISANSATVNIQSHLANAENQSKNLTLNTSLIDHLGQKISSTEKKMALDARSHQHINQSLTIEAPTLWHPDQPYLYWLECSLFDHQEQKIDEVRIRVGIRSIEVRGDQGLYINGRAFEDKLIGVNRHQYHACVGTALSNNMHWHDVKKLRDAGMRVIRTAHYPQSPAFMDAADELGMLLLIPSIGWQFWNDSPVFISQAKLNIRQKIRRDRNHASAMAFEPALNETHQPEHFLKDIYQIVHEEFPYGAIVPLDSYLGAEQYSDMVYAHPNQMRNESLKSDQIAFDLFKGKPSFTREWGDNVDDWNSHNSSSRVHRSWGEQAQIVQAMHYALGSGDGAHQYATSINTLYRTPRQHVGGTLWHGFDHQRGYHPEQFWGGIMDSFRQQKYSYDIFRCQRNPLITHPIAESGYHIAILHELTPISSADVIVCCNAEQVRLSFCGTEIGTITVKNDETGIPYKPAVFKNVYDFMAIKDKHRAEQFEQACLIAEGLVDGHVVCREVKYPARRPTRIRLRLLDEDSPIVADGSQLVTVIAEVTDDSGNIKRLARSKVKFAVFGEAELITSERADSNPRTVEWGTAPALIRTSLNAGEIRIQAHPAVEGLNSLIPDEVVIYSQPATQPLLANEQRCFEVDKETVSHLAQKFAVEKQHKLERHEALLLRLKGVEEQQTECGETPK
ncbi:hypothetical protein DI392_03615 [Vibrio albus]|uniref:Beta-galactosidase n=1 Tax=Vibrio albus TaxID=2200953 RepID=A0A2U3BF03_9VIBR|nr:sugar-binding domain-containing protein [Vibrio albus]PWI35361.1 hypothetical protein DI392_03615 [Vibrio albus]